MNNDSTVSGLSKEGGVEPDMNGYGIYIKGIGRGDRIHESPRGTGVERQNLT
jgi:hypothetical protein